MSKGESQETFHGAVDTLRMSDRAQAELIQRMHRAERASRVDNRNAPRLEYAPADGLIITVQHPGGSTIRYLIRPRNLSRGGMSFLHGQFIYPGTACTINLRTNQDHPVRVEGRITRCNHVQGRVHEIGVQFDSAIAICDYVDICPPDARETREEAPLPRFTGKALHVQTHACDRELMRFLLESTGVEPVSATTDAEAVEAAAHTRFDIIFIADGHTDLIARIRQSAFTGPVLFVTSHDSGDPHRQALASGATRVLVKPFTPRQFAALLAEHLPGGAQGADPQAIVSDHWSNVRMRPLILSFLGSLEEQLAKIEQLSKESNLAPLREIYLAIKGNAGSFGYEQISEKARQVCDLSADNAPPQQWQLALEELRGLCDRACIIRRGIGAG